MSEIRETLLWWTSLCAQRPLVATMVVEDRHGRVVGFVSAGPERAGGPAQRAEVYTLYMLDDFQRRGLGTQLISAAADRLKNAGFTSLVVWVLAGNPARAFYEALGAQAAAARTIRMGGKPIQEIGYTWPELVLARADTRRA